MRTVSYLSSYRASRIAYGVDKQLPLAPCEYIVLPFRIVYIRSVSVVATHPTPYPILREFDKKDEFNNALRSLMSDNLSEVNHKGRKKRLASMLKRKIFVDRNQIRYLVKSLLVTNRPVASRRIFLSSVNRNFML